MTFYQYIPFIMILLLIAFIISSVFLKKNNSSLKLFVEGLKHENSGNFEEAIRNYENALSEVKKSRFRNNLENKIVQKLKVLHSILEYKSSLGFTRQYSSNR